MGVLERGCKTTVDKSVTTLKLKQTSWGGDRPGYGLTTPPPKPAAPLEMVKVHRTQLQTELYKCSKAKGEQKTWEKKGKTEKAQGKAGKTIGTGSYKSYLWSPSLPSEIAIYAISLVPAKSCSM